MLVFRVPHIVFGFSLKQEVFNGDWSCVFSLTQHGCCIFLKVCDVPTP